MYMLMFCGLMVSAVTFSEKLFDDGGGTGGLMGMLMPDSAEAGSVESILGGLTGAGATDQKKPSVLITPSGELSAEDAAELMQNAQDGAPIALDSATGQPVSTEEARKRRLKLIGKALAEQNKKG